MSPYYNIALSEDENEWYTEAWGCSLYGVGRYIVEDEQNGNKRAAYGKAILKNLSKRLLDKYGKGWSVATLKNAKKFYCVYSEKLNTVYPIDGEKAKHCLANSEEIKKSLSPFFYKF